MRPRSARTIIKDFPPSQSTNCDTVEMTERSGKLSHWKTLPMLHVSQKTTLPFEVKLGYVKTSLNIG
jgi:hypothetical protein